MTKTKKALTTLMGVLVLLTLLPLIGYAAVSRQITYQGQLTDPGGNPVPDGDYEMSFALYDVPTGGTDLWGEAQTVTVTNGIYNVILGQPGNELDPTDFDGDLYLGVTVGTDAEMTPRQPLTSVGYALRAHVADSVAEGGVTEIMIYDGAVTNLKVADQAITEDKIEDGATLAEIKDNDGADSGLDADLFDGQDSSAFASAAYVSSLESRIADLETQVAQLVALLQNVTRVGDDITFGGVNVHIVNGTGTTGGTVNGLGNLIVGYNELRGTGDDRTGSHNIVVGTFNNYSSYGGQVVGQFNAISGPYASVSGGVVNEASGEGASISGGRNNTASSWYASVSGGAYNTAGEYSASVSGGRDNTAIGEYASVSGGKDNTAIGGWASVSGGRFNKASGEYSSVAGGGGAGPTDGNEAFAHYAAVLGGHANLAGDPNLTDHSIGMHSSVSGGRENTASNYFASVSGGAFNIASGDSASVSGGRNNKASGEYSSVAGGGGENSPDGNEAFANYSAVLGGKMNIAGDPALTDHTIGMQSSVSGGRDNTASGEAASVSGGLDNTASGTYASVSGGSENTAIGGWASVSGGRFNKASGEYSSVAGGGGENPTDGNEAFANYAAVLGGYNNLAGDPALTDHTIGMQSSVSGGRENTASGDGASVSGGRFNKASGEYSSVAGGGGEYPAEGNEAFANYSAVLGGLGNLAGDPDLTDHSIGMQSSVSGGWDNTASGDGASVSGGFRNTASGYYASVSGGDYNTASGYSSSVSGGRYNEASYSYASVSGGRDNTAIGEYASVSGGYSNKASGEHASVSGGDFNEASVLAASVTGGSSNIASGVASSVSGGYNRSVSGGYDWRAGGYFQDY